MATFDFERENGKDHWQFNNGVLERNKHMFENKIATDVTFKVRNSQNETLKEKKIMAHKYILISGSPVFMSMFHGEMAEKGEVTVPDVEPHAFTEMLRYLYYEEANLCGESVMQVLYASKKYLIPGLTKICTSYLEQELNSENVCDILEQSLLFDEDELVSCCMDYIEYDTERVLRSDGFRKVSQPTLFYILASDHLSIGEVDLVKACVEWAREEMENENSEGGVQAKKAKIDGSRIREKLGNSIYKIRFPQMSLKDFADVVIPFDFLTKDEENLCFRYLAQSNKPLDMPFHEKNRTPAQKSPKWLLPEKDFPLRLHGIVCRSYSITVTNICDTPLGIDAIKTFIPIEAVDRITCSRQKRHPLFNKYDLYLNVFINNGDYIADTDDDCSILHVDRQIIHPKETLHYDIDLNVTEHVQLPTNFGGVILSKHQMKVHVKVSCPGMPITGVFASPEQLN